MLYSFYQHENGDVAFFEKELFKSLDKVYNLYIYVLALFTDLHHNAYSVIDEHKNKRLPTKEDLNPNLKFINNTLLIALSESKELKKEIEKQRVSWVDHYDVVRKLYNEICVSEDYRNYIAIVEPGVKDDRNLLINIVVNHLDEHDLLNHVFEEQNIHWADDTFLAFNSAIRTFETFDGKFKLMPLLKDVEDDKLFVSALFKKTIQYNAEYEELIQAHTKNWELDRIANMDMLLMKMAIAEILHLKNVPVKVSLNEYIDISKEYSTPNSKTFINGVLDKIILQLKNEGKIEKTGRGLQE
ncbi:MAG TPA: transcription antitermination factor NusB [Bacteroidia bacterium]|nr:transcription antitermination factor NusB [Bacteroidia bacterium]